ncbi:hypothetical protein NKR19_g1946 [Coniochaeta hoffmannii]|uniref:Uncharacterized protein n=1 Tax=Coniochaeta hoffmannii TaxID=91930 RepID=A0AA38W2U9_9PEZI|nr:hypothetical protein NKR19_g1946 [Coniochaeta hoffmannii]
MSLAAKSSLVRSASITIASRRATFSYQPERLSSSSSQQHTSGTSKDAQAAPENQTSQHAAQAKKVIDVHKKTMAELDEELRLKLEGISGDGGASGVEYENGKAQGLRRNVKANMFRVI